MGWRGLPVAAAPAAPKPPSRAAGAGTAREPATRDEQGRAGLPRTGLSTDPANLGAVARAAARPAGPVSTRTIRRAGLRRPVCSAEDPGLRYLRTGPGRAWSPRSPASRWCRGVAPGHGAPCSRCGRPGRLRARHTGTSPLVRQLRRSGHRMERPARLAALASGWSPAPCRRCHPARGQLRELLADPITRAVSASGLQALPAGPRWHRPTPRPALGWLRRAKLRAAAHRARRRPAAAHPRRPR